MNDLRHYAGELEQMQSLPLEIKIRMTKMRIQQWVYAFSGEAYISFSGGKDSTVLLNIAREVFPPIFPPCSVILVWNTRKSGSSSKGLKMWFG